MSAISIPCPNCGSSNSHVTDTRSTYGGTAVRRRRSCDDCMRRWTTYEQMELDKTINWTYLESLAKRAKQISQELEAVVKNKGIIPDE